MMIFNKWFFRKIFTQKKQTLFQLLPFLLSVIVLIGTLGSYAFLLTKKQSEYLDQPLDISIQVDGANLKIVEDFLLPALNKFSFERVDYFSRTQFVLPIEQIIVPDISNPNHQILSAGSIAPIHCLVLTQSLQEKLNINLNSSDFVVSQNLLSLYNKEVNDSLDIWVQLISNTIFTPPPSFDDIPVRSITSDGTTLADTLTSVTSRKPLIWLDSNVTKVFGEEIETQDQFFYSPLLFNISDLNSLNFQNNHVGQLNNFNKGDSNEAYYIMMSTSMVNNTVWGNDLTDYTLAIDLEPNILKNNQNDLLKYLKGLSEEIYEEFRIISDLLFLEDMKFTISNHLLTKIDTVNDMFSNLFYDSILDFIPFFGLNMILGYVIQSRAIDKDEKIKDLAYRRGASRFWLFKFFSYQTVISMGFALGITVSFVKINSLLFEQTIAIPEINNVVNIIIYLFAWQLSFQIEAIRRKIFLKNIDLGQEEHNRNLAGEYTDSSIIKGGFTFYLFAITIILLGNYFVSMFEEIFQILELGTIKLVFTLFAAIIFLIFLLNLTEKVFNYFISRIETSSSVSDVSQILKDWNMKIRSWDINFLIRKIEPFGIVSALFRSIKKATKMNRSIWLIFTLYLMSFGFYSYPRLNDEVNEFVSDHDTTIKDGLITLPPGYDPSEFLTRINHRPEINTFLPIYQIDWSTEKSAIVKFLYTDVSRFVNSFDLFDEIEDEEVKDKIRALRYKSSECLFNKETAKELNYDVEDVMIFNVRYYDSINSLLNLEGISYTLKFTRNIEITGVLESLPLPFDFDALLDDSALPFSHPQMLFKVPKLFVNLRAVVVDFEGSSTEKASFTQWLKNAYPDCQFYDSNTQNLAKEMTNAKQPFTVSALMIYQCSIIIGCLVIIWLFNENILKTTKPVKEQLSKRGYSEYDYSDIRSKFTFRYCLFQWFNSILILTFYIIFQMSQGIGTSATMKLAFKTSLIYAILLVICGGIVIGWLSHSMTKTKKEFTY